MSNVSLKAYSGEQATTIQLIQQFWKTHNDYDQSEDAALEDLKLCTMEGHKFFFICKEDAYVGFVHLGSRGCAIDWLEDIFVAPTYQNQGIGTSAIQAVEEAAMQYLNSLYIEAVARNQRAIALYQRLGYRCLNTITVRKDFLEDVFDVVRNEMLYDLNFEIRKERRPC